MNAVEDHAIRVLEVTVSDELIPYVQYVENALRFREEFDTIEEFYGKDAVSDVEGMNPQYVINTYERAVDAFASRLIRELVSETVSRDFAKLHDEINRFENDLFLIKQIFGKK